MCEICLQTPCSTSCPNSYHRAVCVCVNCGNEIYEDERIYKINDEIWCERCIDDCMCYAEADCNRWDED